MTMPTKTERIQPLAISPWVRERRAPGLGAHAKKWIERNLVHAEGDSLGDPWHVTDWQYEDILEPLYRLKRDGSRQVRRVLVVMPKGCGKTELGAAVACLEFAGPTTLDAHRKPIRRRSPNIPIGAASFEQANLLFGSAKTMMTEGRLGPFIEAWDTEILLKGDVGRMFRVAAAAGTNDGGRPTCFFADEIHEWVGNKARVHLVIGNSLAKRANGTELNFTTPDDADPDSLLGKMVSYGKQVAAGEIDDPSFLYLHYGAPDEYKLKPADQMKERDRVELRKVIRQASPASWVDPNRVAARWEIDRVPEHEFRRYHLAQFVRGAKSWLPAGAWDDRGTPRDPLLPPAAAEIVLALDGSYNNDSTALVGCTCPPFELVEIVDEDTEERSVEMRFEEPPYLFVVGCWERPEKHHEEWLVPRAEVNAAVDDAMKRWKVLEFPCDPPGWHQEIEKWGEIYGEVVTIKYATNQPTVMVPACGKFYSAVVTPGKLEHDGDARAARHLANAVTKDVGGGQSYITKERRDSPRKIDIAVGMVIAYDRATAADLTRRSVYETRGLLSLEDGDADDEPIELDDDEFDVDEGAMIRERRRREQGE